MDKIIQIATDEQNLYGLSEGGYLYIWNFIKRKWERQND